MSLLNKIVPYISQSLLIVLSAINSYLVIQNFGPEGKGTIAIIGSITQTVFTILSSGIKQSYALKVKSEEMSYSVAINRALSLSVLIVMFALVCGLLLWICFKSFLYIFVALIIGLQVGTSYMGFAPLVYKHINVIYILRLIPLLLLFIYMSLGGSKTIILYFEVLLFSWLLVFMFYVVYYFKGNLLIGMALSKRVGDIWTAYPFAIGGILINLVFRFDLLQMRILNVDLSEIGIYSLGVNLADIFNALTSVLLTRIFIKDLAAKDSVRTIKLRKQVILSITLGLLIILCIQIFALPQIIYFIGEDWIGVFRIFPFVGTASLFMLAFNILNAHIVSSFGKANLSYVALIVGLLLNILLNQILIPKYGVSGAAFSSLFSYLMIFVIFYIYVSRYISSKSF